MNRILLVDDDHVHHVVTGLQLKKLPFQVETQKSMNGLEAIELLRQDPGHTPDLILLDLNMPVMNGWDFLAEFEDFYNGREKKPVIVILSSTIAPDDLTKAKSYGSVHSFISKPFLKNDMIRLFTELGFS